MNESAIKQSAAYDEDFVLVREASNGYPESFNRLVLKYQHPIFNLCYRMLDNYQDAEDCTQEVFVKAYQGLKNFKFQAQFGTWLYRIAVNACKNKQSSLEFRWRSMISRIDRGNETENGVYKMELKDKSAGPAELLEQNETAKLILEAVNMLPNDQRLIIFLCDFEGRSYEEIVEITGHKLGTVKSKLARARAKLRGKLAGVVNNG